MANNLKHYSNLEALYSDYSNGNLNFEDADVRVEVPSVFSMGFAEDDKHKEGLFPFTAKAYHDETNVNGSHIESDIFVENSKSMVLRPVLANIITTEDGKKDFGAHDFEEYIDEDGEYVCKYIEKPVGVITSYDFSFDNKQKVNRAIAYGVIYEGYSQEAIEILKERKSVSCSIELSVRGLHFDKETNVLFLDDYYVTGLTLLGETHSPGMVGSELHLEDDNSSVVFNYFNSLSEEKMQRLLNIGDVLFYEEKEPKTKGDDGMNSIKHIYPFEKDGELYTCEVALTDRQMEINQLLWESRRDIGDVVVYDTFAVFREWGSVDWFKQNYSETDGKCALDGEPVPVKCHWITAEEEASQKAETEQKFSELNDAIAELKEKYADYEDIKTKLEAYESAELKAQKEAVLADEAYSEYLETEEFSAIKEAMEEMSVEELRTKAELAFAKQVRKNKKDVSEQKDTSTKKLFTSGIEDTEPKSKYGKIFDKH